MAEAVTTPLEPPRRIYLDWLSAVIFTPRQVFPKIAAQARNIWLTPMFLLTITAVALVIITGPLRLTAAQMNMNLPPDFTNYPPEMQTQIIQSAQATQTPVFIYVFPAIIAVARVWLGWLVVGGLLHLVLTLLGGRGNTGTAMNLVAWSALPLAVRDIVRIIAVQSTHALIASPGLSGFAPAGEGRLEVYLAKLLALIDIYVLWHAALLIFGVRQANGLSRGKAWAGVLITLVLALNLQALLSFLTTLLGSINSIRPFMMF